MDHRRVAYGIDTLRVGSSSPCSLAGAALHSDHTAQPGKCGRGRKRSRSAARWILLLGCSSSRCGGAGVELNSVGNLEDKVNCLGFAQDFDRGMPRLIQEDRRTRVSATTSSSGHSLSDRPRTHVAVVQSKVLARAICAVGGGACSPDRERRGERSRHPLRWPGQRARACPLIKPSYRRTPSSPTESSPESEH